MDQITSKVEGNKTSFSCGCVTELIGKNFIMVPCSADCEVFMYCIEQSKKQGKIMSYHVSTGEDTK